MDLLEKVLAYASTSGKLQGTISGIIKYSSDEISPRIKEVLETVLKEVEEDLEKLK